MALFHFILCSLLLLFTSSSSSTSQRTEARLLSVFESTVEPEDALYSTTQDLDDEEEEEDVVDRVCVYGDKGFTIYIEGEWLRGDGEINGFPFYYLPGQNVYLYVWDSTDQLVLPPFFIKQERGLSELLPIPLSLNWVFLRTTVPGSNPFGPSSVPEHLRVNNAVQPAICLSPAEPGSSPFDCEQWETWNAGSYIELFHCDVLDPPEEPQVLCVDRDPEDTGSDWPFNCLFCGEYQRVTPSLSGTRGGKVWYKHESDEWQLRQTIDFRSESIGWRLQHIPTGIDVTSCSQPLSLWPVSESPAACGRSSTRRIRATPGTPGSCGEPEEREKVNGLFLVSSTSTTTTSAAPTHFPTAEPTVEPTMQPTEEEQEDRVCVYGDNGFIRSIVGEWQQGSGTVNGFPFYSLRRHGQLFHLYVYDSRDQSVLPPFFIQQQRGLPPLQPLDLSLNWVFRRTTVPGSNPFGPSSDPPHSRVDVVNSPAMCLSPAESGSSPFDCQQWESWHQNSFIELLPCAEIEPPEEPQVLCVDKDPKYTEARHAREFNCIFCGEYRRLNDSEALLHDGKAWYVHESGEFQFVQKVDFGLLYVQWELEYIPSGVPVDDCLHLGSVEGFVSPMECDRWTRQRLLIEPGTVGSCGEPAEREEENGLRLTTSTSSTSTTTTTSEPTKQPTTEPTMESIEEEEEEEEVEDC